MKKGKLILKKRIKETEDTVTLVFEQKEGEEKLIYEAGQYLHLVIEGGSKIYTMSSAPHEENINISVKKKNNFSVKLHKLEIGDEIGYIGPTGFLILSEIEEGKRGQDLVYISAGIGITPFYSILKSQINDSFKQKVSLFYANKNKENTIFYNKFKQTESEHNNFKVHHYWSDEENKLNVEKIKDKLGVLENKTFLICGPIKFTEEFWKILRDNGVEEDDIHTESFFAQ